MQATSLVQLDRELGELVAALHRAEQDWAPWLRRTRPSWRASARNLVHYWALRQHDLQDLQQTLSAYGLSSLGRSEPHVGASLEVMQRDALRMRKDRPFVFTNLKTGEGLDRVVDFIVKQGALAHTGI